MEEIFSNFQIKSNGNRLKAKISILEESKSSLRNKLLETEISKKNFETKSTNNLKYQDHVLQQQKYYIHICPVNPLSASVALI